MKNKKKLYGESTFKIFVGLFFVTGCLYMNMVQARYRTVKSEKRLYSIIDKAPFAAVLFYYEDKDTRKDKEQKSAVDRLLQLFKAMSRSFEYKDADMAFVVANTARDELKELAQRFVDQLPAVILFKGGSPVKTKDGEIVIVKDQITREAIASSIERYLDNDIDQYKEAKEEHRRLRSYYYPYAYPYYPYYGYYGPYFGFGVSGCW